MKLFEELKPSKKEFYDHISNEIRLLSLKSFGATAYAKEEAGLPYTGEGAYKIVFSLGPNKVLKVAKNNPGTNDIKREKMNYECSPNHFPKVFEHHENYNWAVVERIKNTYRTNKNLQKDIEDYFELDYYELTKIMREEYGDGSIYINSFGQILKILDQYRIGNKDTKIFKYLFSKPKLVSFLREIKKCNISFWDLHLNNLGISKAGHFVIIDSMDMEKRHEFELDENVSLVKLIYSEI